MAAYTLTQEVEKAVRRYAVDAFINYGRMEAAELLTGANIDAVPYSPAVSLAEVFQRPENTATFEAYGHGSREVHTIKAAVTALFETQPVWTYADLWSAVRTAGQVKGLAVNPSSFSEESFALALDGLGLHSPFLTREAEAASQAGNLGAGFLISRVQDFFIRTPAGPGGQPTLDIESYVRDDTSLSSVRIKVADYVRNARAEQNFIVRLEGFEASFKGSKTPIEDVFLFYDADFHYALLRAIVEGHALQKEAPGVAADVYALMATPGSALGRAVALYTRFKVLVLGGDFAETPAALRYLRAARAPQPGNKTPIGYVAADSVRVFGGEAEGWYDIPRKALSIGSRYNENDIAVGYVEFRGGHPRFKVRAPIHELSASNVRDVRSLARGAECKTRPRSEQEVLASRLEALKKKSSQGGRSMDICAEVRANLLEREEASRQKKLGMLGGTRWFYLFNDRLPTVTLGR
ncbi:BA71V-D1133L (G10L) protein [Elysia marginata]|uniref:BA71V-D1133L (G10L) protein n=1 Tax=Elysia marginata TaxID=1093978 RepID=A0AAV4GWM6_9GAST|nr:BA71V-D1133L (G10L) protein [Elysia marginata]